MRAGLSAAARPAMMLAFAALVLARVPHVVTDGGRFWAEEGVVYFLNAWTKPWYAAWFAIHTGYINLAAGFGTWAGLQLGGLAHAPAITVVFALLIQCLPVYAILTHDFPWRHSTLATAAAVSLCALPPLTDEVWLNTITSQFHLALFAALVLAAPEARRGMFVADCAILCFAALSGPTVTFLMPLFALRALWRRDLRAAIPALIVFAGFCLQASIYAFRVMPERGGRLGATALLSMIALHTIVLQFAGFDVARDFAARLGAAHAAHRILWAGPAIFIGFHGGLAWMIFRLRSGVLAWLLAATVVIAIVSFYESLGGTFDGFLNVDAGQRYAFIAEVTNALLVLGVACASRGVTRAVFAAATVLLLAVSVAEYRHAAILFTAGPRWAPQVAAWTADPRRPLVVWPGPPWQFVIAPR